MKKYFFLFLLFQFQLSFVNAQIDSLLNELKHEKTDTGKVLLHIGIARHYGWNLPDSTIAHATIAKNISKKLNYDKGLFLSYFSLCEARYVTGEYGKGLNEAKEALSIARKNKREDWEIKIYGSLGLLYLQTKKYKEAKEYFELLVTLQSKNKNLAGLSSAINNLANCYFYLEDFSKSIEIRKKAIVIRKKLNNENALGDSYNDIGETYFKLGMLDSSIYYLKKCFEIKERLHDDEMAALSSLNLGIVYMKKGNMAVAKQYLNKSYFLALKIKSKSYQLEVLKELSNAARLEKNSKQEAEFLRIFVALKDSVYNEENQKQINQLQTEFDTEKKELKIKSLQTEQKQQQIIMEEEKKRSNLIVIFSVSGFILLISFLLVINNRFRVTKRQNVIIDKQRLIVEEKNKDITDSINYAKRIQEAILPAKDIKYKIFPNAFVFFQPKDIVSGDFYWFAEKNGKRIIAAVDCTGHGVPGAFMSMIGNAFLNEIINEKGTTTPSIILDKLREKIIFSLKQTGAQGENKDGMDISLLSFDSDNKRVEFAGANNPLWKITNKKIEEIKGDKQPIGIFSGELIPFTNHIIDIEKGDTLYIFTDGYADQFGGENGKKFKYKQIQTMLLDINDKSMSKQEDYLNKSINEWKGKLEQVDDILLIGIRV